MLYAALAGKLRSVQYFLEQGCDYMHRGQDGRSVLEVAEGDGSKLVVKLFAKWKRDKSVRVSNGCCTLGCATPLT